MRKDDIQKKHFILGGLYEVEFTPTYAFAIHENGMIKACIIDDAREILPLVTVVENHDGVNIRMNGTRANMDLIKTYSNQIIDVCTVEYFENYFKQYGNRGSNNRGHIFEKMLCDILGGKQADSMNAKCTETGDIIVDGRHIQCKLWNATVTTENTVLNFLKAKGLN